MALLKLNVNDDKTVGDLLLKLDSEILGISFYQDDQILITEKHKIALVQLGLGRTLKEWHLDAPQASNPCIRCRKFLYCLVDDGEGMVRWKLGEGKNLKKKFKLSIKASNILVVNQVILIITNKGEVVTWKDEKKRINNNDSKNEKGNNNKKSTKRTKVLSSHGVKWGGKDSVVVAVIMDKEVKIQNYEINTENNGLSIIPQHHVTVKFQKINIESDTSKGLLKQQSFCRSIHNAKRHCIESLHTTHPSITTASLWLPVTPTQAITLSQTHLMNIHMRCQSAIQKQVYSASIQGKPLQLVQQNDKLLLVTSSNIRCINVEVGQQYASSLLTLPKEFFDAFNADDDPSLQHLLKIGSEEEFNKELQTYNMKIPLSSSSSFSSSTSRYYQILQKILNKKWSLLPLISLQLPADIQLPLLDSLVDSKQNSLLLKLLHHHGNQLQAAVVVKLLSYLLSEPQDTLPKDTKKLLLRESIMRCEVSAYSFSSHLSFQQAQVLMEFLCKEILGYDDEEEDGEKDVVDEIKEEEEVPEPKYKTRKRKMSENSTKKFQKKIKISPVKNEIKDNNTHDITSITKDDNDGGYLNDDVINNDKYLSRVVYWVGLVFDSHHTQFTIKPHTHLYKLHLYISTMCDLEHSMLLDKVLNSKKLTPKAPRKRVFTHELIL